MSTQVPETVEEESATEAASAGKQKHDAKKHERAERAQEQREVEAVEKARSADDTYHLKASRYDPEVPEKQGPRFDGFHVPYRQGMTILDALMWARDYHDFSLTFRHSRRQATCGSDALFINGSQRLGCKTQLSDPSEPIRVEPLPHPDVVKDLVIDMEYFYDQMESAESYFQTNSFLDGKLDEQHQTRKDHEKVKMFTRCTWYSACMSSCNIATGDNEYLGPAAINKVYHFAMDEREGEDMRQHRFEIPKQKYGVWRCQIRFSCTEVCPEDIPLAEYIQELKYEAIKNNLKFW